MKSLNVRRWSLTLKLPIILAILIIITVVAITMVSVQRERSSFRGELQTQADVILATLENAIANPLYMLDTNFLTNAMAAFRESDSGILARVYDEDGRLIADGESDNELTFNLAIDPLGQQLVDSDEIRFDWREDHLLAGKAVNIGGQVIGAISIKLSTAPLDMKMRTVGEQGLIVALIGTFIGIGISLLVSRTITGPLQMMTEATKRISQGDLSHRIPTNIDGELAILATAFNDMAIQLHKTIQDLEHTATAITEQNNKLEAVNAELKMARDQALEASRLKDEFLSTMSHELRTPLNAIIGFQGILLLGGQLDERSMHMVSRAQANAERLLTLINDILDISRIESGRLQLISTELPLAGMVEKWKSHMGILAEEKGIDFLVHVDESLPETVYADEDAITKIVTNLLGNAFKFTNQGKVNLNLTRGNGNWIIEVSDTGAGIPPHMQEIIFERFRQVDGSSKRKHGGSGLGLAIVRNLCQAMQGTVNVQSTPNEGSVFTVSLPLKQKENQYDGF